MTEHDTLQDRVERGAEWLDAVRPEWWTEIDVGTLDLRSWCRCVLGQIAGYLPVLGVIRAALGEANDATAWMEDHGFESRVVVGGGRGEYAALDELWIAQIKARWSGEQVA